MPLAQEDMDLIKSRFDDWLVEALPEQKIGIYDLELRTRMLKVEEEFRHQRELMQQGFALMEKRFEQVDKRLEQVDKRFETIQQTMDKRFEAMQQSMENRFEQMDKRFEAMQQSMDKRFDELTRRIDKFMRWSFGLTVTAAGIIIAVMKLTF